jgi:hypothetical protein
LIPQQHQPFQGIFVIDPNSKRSSLGDVSRSELEFLKESHSEEVFKLNVHHAREITALKLVHKNEISSLKEHHAKAIEQLKLEIARLHRPSDRLDG